MKYLTTLLFFTQTLCAALTPGQEVMCGTLHCKIIHGHAKAQAPLIIIHGGPGLSSGYLEPLEELETNRAVIFYDQRGSGRSKGEISENSLSIQAQLTDIESIRKFLSAERISILGHSWGGFLAMHYAISYPDRIEKLILSNSMPASSDDSLLFFAEYQKKTKPYKDAIDAIVKSKAFEEKEPKAVEAYYKTVFQAYCYRPEMAEKLSLEMSHDACIHGAKTFDIIRQSVLMKPYNLFPSLEALDCETLIIHGSDDLIPYRTAQKIHQIIKGSSLCLLNECGHFPFIEKKEEYFEVIKKFLDNS